MKTPTLCLIAVLVVPAALAAPARPPSQPPVTPSRPEVQSGLPTGSRGVAGQVYVGEAAPGFELMNAEERWVKLSRYRGDRVLLYFADRREAIPQYRAVADSLRKSGVLLVSISRDSPRALRSLAARDSLNFELLSDPTGEVAAIYGSYEFATSTIQPGYVLVGRTSLVRMALLGQTLPPEDLLRITRYALIGL